MKRRSFIILPLAALLAPSVPFGRPAHAQAGKVQGTATEWLSYGGVKSSSKYSPLDQIDRDNFSRLKVGIWRSTDEAITKANPDLKTWSARRRAPFSSIPSELSITAGPMMKAVTGGAPLASLVNQYLSHCAWSSKANYR